MKVPNNVLMIAYTNYRTDPRVIREAEAAVDGGFKVDFITLRRDGEPAREVINGVGVVRLKQTRYRGGGVLRYLASYLEFFLRCLVRTSWLHLGRRYRVVHVNNMPDFFVFCAILPKLTGAKVILDIHDPMPNTFASKFKEGEDSLAFKMLLWQERLSARFADKVLTVHDPVKDEILVRQHRLPAESIQVVANFADDNLFKLRPPEQAVGRLKLVFHGTILERYGLGGAMVALAEMRNRNSISVRIIGEGDYSERLKKQISDLSLEDVVTFDNRMYPLHEIPARLEGCNLGLVPLEISSMTNYALPLKLLEYLSLGIPSITVRNAAISYYFDENDCIFYDPKVPASLRVVMDRLVDNPELLQRFRQRAVVLRERFLWSREKQKYLAVLRELSNGG